MQSLGKRLEEARKARGVSLREASEATKIRTSYLASFENDDFDIPLPDIYKRGFIKLYARYLKMEVEEIAREVRLQLDRRNKIESRGEIRPGLGQIELNRQVSSNRDEPGGSGKPRIRLGRLSVPGFGTMGDRPETEIEPSDPGEDIFDREFYVKVGLAVAAVVLGVIVLFLFLQLIFGGSSDEAVTEGSNSAEIVSTDLPPNVMAVVSRIPITLILRDPDTKEILFSDRLLANEERVIPLQGVIPEVAFSDGTDLTIRYRGQTFTVKGKPGPQRIRPNDFLED